MGPTARGHLDNSIETPLAYERCGPFAWRYAYQRSADARKSSSVGQDAVAYRASEDRFAIALCDGVGNSFLGEIAASFLANELMTLLWELKQSPESVDDLRFRLGAQLQELTSKARGIVDGAQLPRSLPAIAAEAMERKRVSGSQSTLVAAMVSLQPDSSAWVAIVRLGDSRIRFWADGVEDQDCVGVPMSGQVWSSHGGILGGSLAVAIRDVHPAASIRIVAYSDGLDILDHGPWPRSTRAIQSSMELAADRSGSDDASFIEVALRQALGPEVVEALPAPADVTAAWAQDELVCRWLAVPGATQYEVQRQNGAQRTVVVVGSPYSLGVLPRRRYSVRVRALAGAEPGLWSAFALPVAPPSEPQPVPVDTHISPRVRAGTIRSHARPLWTAAALLACVLIASVGALLLLPGFGHQGTVVPASGATGGLSSSLVAQASPGATTTLTPVLTAEPSASATSTAAPSRVTPSPAESSACTGRQPSHGFFSSASRDLPFSVYCGVMPTGWYVAWGQYTFVDGGQLEVTYSGPQGETIYLYEGLRCMPAGSGCPPDGDTLGPANFGDMAGTLYSLGSADGYVVYSGASLSGQYKLVGSGVSQANMLAMASRLVRIGS
jgi:serine/threonine protein phosphatase PrpC